MSDNLFSAVLTFSLLAAGTAAVGAEMMATRPTAKATAACPTTTSSCRGPSAHNRNRPNCPWTGWTPLRLLQTSARSGSTSI